MAAFNAETFFVSVFTRATDVRIYAARDISPAAQPNKIRIKAQANSPTWLTSPDTDTSMEETKQLAAAASTH